MTSTADRMGQNGTWRQPVNSWPRRALGAALVAVLVAAAGTLPAPAHAASTCLISSPAGSYSVEICIDAPGDGAEVSDDVVVTASATSTSGAPGISRMTFLLDGQDLLVDFEAPYTFVLPTDTFADGSKSLSLRATMRDGQVTDAVVVSLLFSNGLSSPPPVPTGFTPNTGTAPSAGSPLVVVATGDGASGQTSSDQVVDVAVGMDPDIFVYTGDVYDDGTYTEFKNWYGEGTRFGRLAAITTPLLGNHEQTSAGWEGFDRYWHSPPPFYSYDAGGWHFIVLNSDGRFNQLTPGTPQFDWLASDLAANESACTIVGFHHPVLSVGPQGDSTRLDAVWQLLTENGVDIALTGHDHNYQRWYPLNSDKVRSPDGLTQFVLGGGGHGIQAFQRSDSRLAAGADTVPAAFGALKLELSSNGASFEYRNTGDAVLDSGTLPCSGSTDDTTAPSAPSGLTAVVNGTGVDLEWVGASDDVGVHEYIVRRDSTAIATLSGHELSFTDTTVQAGESYTYDVLARDAAGNTSAPSNEVTVDTPPAATTLTLQPSADSYVNEASPTSNYGAAKVLRVDGSPVVRSYMTFDLASVSGNVTSAKLRLYATSSHNVGFEVRSTGTAWEEQTLTYANAPAVGGLVAASGALASGSYKEIDVTNAVTSGGTGVLGLALTGVNGTALSVGSGESTTPPELVLERNTASSGEPPSAGDVAVTTPEDTAASWTPIVTDPDQDELTCSITTPPSNGQATVVPDCSSGTYTPQADSTGEDSFVYSVSDGAGTDTGLVSVSITGVNDAPTVDPASLTLTAGTTETVALRATDPDGDCPLTFEVVSAPLHGSLGALESVQCNQGAASAAITYAASSDYEGPDSFEVTATDPTGATSAVRAVSISVEPRQTLFTLNPSADTYVAASSPTANYGGASQLRLDTSPEMRGYLTFSVPDLTGDVVSASLRVYAGSKHPLGFRLAATGTGWTERGLTYENAPAPGAVLGESGPTATNGWNEIDVTGHVSRDGDVGFVLLPLNQTSLKLWARESSRPPELTIETN